MAMTTLPQTLSVLRPLGTQLRAGVVSVTRRSWRWWTNLEPSERILYRAVVLLGVGCGLIYPPLAFIVPGVLFGLVFFGFSLRRG